MKIEREEWTLDQLIRHLIVIREDFGSGDAIVYVNNDWRELRLIEGNSNKITLGD